MKANYHSVIHVIILKTCIIVSAQVDISSFKRKNKFFAENL